MPRLGTEPLNSRLEALWLPPLAAGVAKGCLSYTVANRSQLQFLGASVLERDLPAK